MSEFLDVWNQVPHDWQVGLILLAVVLVFWGLGAAIKQCLTFRFRDALARQFVKDFKARDVSDGTDDKGHRRSHRPSPAEALAQLKKCLHVWRVRGGYFTVISYQANQGLPDSELLKRASEATKDADYEHTVSTLGGWKFLHSRIGGR